MKRLLLSTAAVIALSATNAHAAGIPVWCTTCPTEVQEIIRQGQRLAEMAKQLQVAKNQLDEAVIMKNAVMGIRDLGTFQNALFTLGIQNPLPVNAYNLQALMNGTGGANGMINSLAGLFNGASSANAVYRPSLRSWVGQEIERHASAIAGTQAVALQLHQSAGERASQVNELRARIAAARDPATRETLIAQLSALQADAQNQLVQAVSANTFAAAQRDARDQRREEYLQQQIDAELAQGSALGLVPQ